MNAPYHDMVEQLRQAFPQPVSNRLHDSYFVFSFMRALDQVDQLKSIRPMLGRPEPLDYESARQARIAEAPSTLETVTAELVDHLSGMFIWGHPRSQINVIAAPTIPSVIGQLLPSIYNPNLCSEESSRRLALAEIEAISMTADLVGYDVAEAGGLFTFGGTGTLLYGVKIGLEKACPGTARRGLSERAVIVCSEQAHYATLSVADWLGIGQDQVVQIASSPENELRTCLLESQLRDLLKEGTPIAAIIATMGTTDAFGVDDLAAIHDIRDRLAEEFDLQAPPHLHADAVIGWAWSVFNDYDFDSNPLGFRPRTVRALASVARRIRHLGVADSLGVDYHKTGFCPYISSAFLVRNRDDLRLITRDETSMPYLFQSGQYHPGKFTLETSRSAAGPMAALANLRLFGKEGLRALLGHLVSMAEALRENLDGHASTTVLNRGNHGPVTLFRVYPDDVDTFQMPDQERLEARFREDLLKHNEYNRRLFELVQTDALKGEGVVLSLTDCYRESDYGEPIVALKSYIMSPFSEESHIQSVLDSLWKARAQLADSGFR